MKSQRVTRIPACSGSEPYTTSTPPKTTPKKTEPCVDGLKQKEKKEEEHLPDVQNRVVCHYCKSVSDIYDCETYDGIWLCLANCADSYNCVAYRIEVVQ